MLASTGLPARSTISAVTIWSAYGPYHVARLEGLRQAGLDVTPFAYTATDSTYPFFGERPANLVVINDVPSTRVRAIPSFARTLALLLRHRPRLVLSCGYERPESLAALAYARVIGPVLAVRGARCIVMVENAADDRPRLRGVEIVKGWYLRAFHGVLAGGTVHRQYLASLGVDRGRIRVGYDCIDNDLFGSGTAVARRALPPGHTPYLLVIARLVARKNIATLLRAYAAYLAALPVRETAYRLRIGGDGPERPGLERLAEHLGVADRVTFIGQINTVDDTIKLYAGAAAFILPSLTEPWGLVVNEAMAAGLPIVASERIGCAPDLIQNGRNGLLFDPRNAAALAGHLRWLHDHRADLPTMGEVSRHIINQFTPQRMGEAARSFVE